MSRCEQLGLQAADGVSAALRAVDCLAGETTASAFARLFGGSGALAPVLTILLTLYVAGFALALLTGRSRLTIAALTPRMVTLGLVLTFATSWIAYQSVLWNLAVGAPDQIAGAITGSTGSATRIFADRIDLVFAAIAQVAAETGPGGTGAAPTAAVSPASVMWLGGLLLLLGTVGVLVTARIALAVLLAVGPVFVVLGLFGGTRGLTAGWLRGLVMTAVTPLYVVVGGSIVMELLVPVVAALRGGDGQIDGRAAMALVTIAFVHCALLVLIGRVTAATISAWSAFGLARRSPAAGDPGESAARAAAGALAPAAAVLPAPDRLGPRIAPAAVPAGKMGMQPASVSRTTRTVVMPGTALAPPLPLLAGRRARGIGSRFRSRTEAAVTLRGISR